MLCLWRMLGLDELFDRELPAGREEVPWSATVAILAISRFVEPSSELHVEKAWYGRTALPDLLGVPVGDVEEHRLYRTLDQVLPLKDKIEIALKERIGELFQPDVEILLYDLTSTYFEGEAEKNPQAQYGYSRDHRPDAKQVVSTGLAVRHARPSFRTVSAGPTSCGRYRRSVPHRDAASESASS